MTESFITLKKKTDLMTYVIKINSIRSLEKQTSSP